jgi:diguanylate cyclase (GGDEF)-like protein
MFINKLKILNYLKDKEILIVDDSKTALLVNLRAIKKFYPFTKILTAKNGAEALEIIKNNPNIKVIITDYEMPEMDGKSLIKKIREKYDMEEKIIISISSIEEVGLSSTLLKMGANDFLHKPFIEDELLCRIDNNVTTAILIDEMKQMAYKDPLTSLYNRRYFFETAEKLYLTAIREEREIAILMCDIDHFKKINDKYGHSTGDIVIKNTAEILSSNIRKNDIVARYGGEEFVIFLYNCDIKYAYLIGEKIRYKINDSIVKDKGEEIKYTISIGVSNQGETLEDVINNADKMLYLAKKTRNRVVAQKVKNKT